jgi:hypothetical protein
MAPIVMHLVIGERVYPQIAELALTEAYGAFLLGCMLVDVNGFSALDRRETHFVGRPSEDGEDAFYKGSATFLSRLDTLLQRPWSSLSNEEQAFVAGYLCHLAADEAWKDITWHALWAMGITSAEQFPIPGVVMLTAYSVLSTRHYHDAAAVADALWRATVPDVLAHVPYGALVYMWEVVKPRTLDSQTVASYLGMLERKGTPAAEVEARKRQHEIYMDEAMRFIQDLADIEAMLQATVDRSVDIVPRLWS